MIFSIAKDLLGIGADYLKGKREVAQAKVEREKEIVKTENDIQKLRVEKSDKSWKDEYITVLVTIPIIMCFVPELAPYAIEGFETLSTTPEWYQYTFIGVVSAAIGIKGWRSIKK